MDRRSVVLLAFCWLFSWLMASPLLAQDIPPPLRDWQAWVLHGVPQHDCPFLANQMPNAGSYQCAWSGRLTLDANKDGGHFSLDVHVDAPSWVVLPGDARNWPQQVSTNKQPATVLQHEGQPMLWLTAGDYILQGTLPWTARPPRLRVPASIGLITLSVDGAAVTRSERQGDQLTLGEAASAQRAADALSLRVYRRLEDGLPATLETQLQFNVTGSAREQLLGPALPAGFVATALTGDLPARLENDGRLRVQLRPGQWTVSLQARRTDAPSAIVLKLPVAPWPRQEIWSYADNTDLRSTRVDGRAVDAAQAGVPDDWRELPAFALDDTAGLTIEQGARGDEGGQGAQLHLQRELWLDFDGAGLSVADHLSGDLRHHQRLDVATPWQLQRASQGEESLLISKGDNGRSGVEVRQQKIDLSAGLRLPEHSVAVPSAGWQLPLESIDATLHLPQGYRLLGAPGADRSPDSWVAQWSLLDLFIVAVIALLAGRLLGWRWAALAVVFLALAQHEDGAPRWTLAVAIALALLMRALPEGRLRLGARIGAIVLFASAVLWTLPFASTQLQDALHPQLEDSLNGRAVAAGYSAPPAVDEVSQNAVQPPPPVMAAPAPAAEPAPIEYSSMASQSASQDESKAAHPELKEVVVTGSSISSSTQVTHEQNNPDLIQAGGGTPQWNQGNNYHLGWSGPVTPEQTTRLVIAPSWLVRLLRVLMVALLAALLARLALLLLPPLRGSLHALRNRGVAGAVLIVLVLLPHVSHAQSLPDQQLLNQLRTRLTEAPTCAPTCAQIAQAQLQVTADTLGVVLEAHIGAPTALPLPQPDDALQLLDVSVDGHPIAPLARRGDQLLLRLDRGVHRVSLRYRIAAADSASLRFELRPQHIDFAGQGWSLDGVDDGRVLGDSIALNRVRTASDGKDTALAQSFPPYIRLTRSLALGIDWTVENVAERIAPKDGGFSTTLPLLPGEHPLGDDALVKDGRISVTFSAGSDTVHWTSRLDHTTTLTLKAPVLSERAEVWQISTAPMWHVDAKGVPTSASDDGLRYQPLPGETLQLVLSQPIAIAGDSLAFDRVQVDSTTGERVTETTLDLQARSTRGGEHAISLPSGAELLEAKRDDAPINLVIRDGKLNLPLLPGEHDYALRLREPGGVAARLHTPAFALHAPTANIDLTLRPPQDRWVLWTWGPTAGPAVLYWSQLIVLLLASWLLARYAPTPLRFQHWLLLGLGFSAFAWSAYALVVLWLILLGLRARGVLSARLSTPVFNLLQIGLAILTLLALLVLISAVPKGLLGLPDMHVAGNDSSAWQLHWFADQTADALPLGGVLSVSLWVYKIAMLAWALWLANALIGWLRWGFEAWSSGGYWRPKSIPPLPATPDANEEPPHV
ncbi:hypothetical protein [Rhodanobacter sp. A1T4]|uniref:hypothetical protein n=1 Tax=Rhodanobacter sp. A1T4 TaxID=2723087 RepID=UPI00160C362F|nr:hypothetical protein [Rhodanobacter sp. A1T4]MBB6247141.1 hypothetical protein [Rhodanobacter sp. A1T4]